MNPPLEKYLAVQAPDLTVITVVKNGGAALNTTYSSLQSQTRQDFTWLVLDGLSTDGTTEWLRTVTRERFAFFTGKDKSIYDAMNKAVNLVKTEYCLFLNAGDSLVDNRVIDRVLEALAAGRPPLAYGRYIIKASPGFPERERGTRFRSRADLFRGRVPCHQATVIAVSAFREIGPFNDALKVYSDREWLMRLAAVKPCEDFRFLEFPVVYYDPGGYSYHNFFKTTPEYFRMIVAQGNVWEILLGITEWTKMTAYICLSRLARMLDKKSSRVVRVTASV